MNKKVVITLSVISVIILLSSISYSSKIWNPFIGLKGIIQIELSDKKVEQISDKPLRYISRDSKDFINYMKSNGYELEQMGRGFNLRKDDKSILLTSEGFMNRYKIFSE